MIHVHIHPTNHPSIQPPYLPYLTGANFQRNTLWIKKKNKAYTRLGCNLESPISLNMRVFGLWEEPEHLVKSHADTWRNMQPGFEPDTFLL